MKIQIGPIRSVQARAFRLFLQNRGVKSTIMNHPDMQASLVVVIDQKDDLHRHWANAGYNFDPIFKVIP